MVFSTTIFTLSQARTTPVRGTQHNTAQQSRAPAASAYRQYRPRGVLIGSFALGKDIPFTLMYVPNAYQHVCFNWWFVAQSKQLATSLCRVGPRLLCTQTPLALGTYVHTSATACWLYAYNRQQKQMPLRVRRREATDCCTIFTIP